MKFHRNALFHIELAYLTILDRYYVAYPKLLENLLDSDSEFFCGVIRLFIVTKTDVMPTKLAEETIAFSTNIWRLLHYWRTSSIMQKDGSFNSEYFLLGFNV